MWNQKVFLTLLIYLSNGCEANSVMKPKAVISPTRLVARVNSTVEVKCHLNSQDLSVFDLKFFKVKSRITKDVNSTVKDNKTIVTSLGPLLFEDDETWLYCKTVAGSGRTLARKLLRVGVPPEAATNMDCISYNLISMKCTFQWVSRDRLRTLWEIQYTNSGLGGMFTTCITSHEGVCVLGTSSDNTVNPFYPMLHHTFRVNVTNELGSKTSLFEVDPWNVVKPDAVEDLRAVVVNSTCIDVTWSNPSQLLTIFRTQYVITVNASLQPTRTMTVPGQSLVCDLLPNSLVKVSVQCEAIHGGYPSDPRLVQVQMPEDRPRPPTVPAGSYSVVDLPGEKRQIVLYWQALPLRHQNGIVTKYKITVYNSTSELPLFTQNNPNTSVSAVVSPSIDSNTEYRIVLQAKTMEGFSDITDTSTVIVSSEKSVSNRPSWVDIEYNGQGLNTVYWSAETDQPAVVRVYWCYGQWENESHVICQTSIQMRKLSNNSQEQTSIQVDDGSINKRCDTCQWNFGVAMETDGISSGILWNTCRFKKHREPRLSDVVVSNASTSSFTVAWQRTCWLVAQFGRPEFYDLGILGHVTDDPEQCNSAETKRIIAKHFQMVETLEISHDGSVCIRPVGNERTGAWLIRTVAVPNVTTDTSTHVVAGISASIILLGCLILILWLCSRKKLFDTYYIEIPQLRKEYRAKTYKDANAKNNMAKGVKDDKLKSSGSSNKTKCTDVTVITPSPKGSENSDWLKRDVVNHDPGSGSHMNFDLEENTFLTDEKSKLNKKSSQEVLENFKTGSEDGSGFDSDHSYSLLAMSERSPNDSTIVFSGSYNQLDENNTETNSNMSYVQASLGADIMEEGKTTFPTRQATTSCEGQGQGDSSGSNSIHVRHPNKSLIDGSDYLYMDCTINPNTGCYLYHYGNDKVEKSQDRSSVNDKGSVLLGGGRNIGSVKHGYEINICSNCIGNAKGPDGCHHFLMSDKHFPRDPYL